MPILVDLSYDSYNTNSYRYKYTKLYSNVKTKDNRFIEQCNKRKYKKQYNIVKLAEM